MIDRDQKLPPIIETISLYKNWLRVLAEESGEMQRSKYYIYQLRNGVKYKVRARTSDIAIINEIWKHKTYTPKNFKINKNDVVLDIGAQIGVFSLYASKQAINGKVISFEPMTENYKLLKQNISINSINNIYPVNMAVSGKDGKKSMYLDRTNTGGHSFFFDSGKSRKVKVRTISMKRIFDKYKLQAIDFLKMDCEGAEFDILFNCPKDIITKINSIVMEYHNLDRKRNIKYLSAYLRKNGFSITVYPNKLAKSHLIYGLGVGELYAKRRV